MYVCVCAHECMCLCVCGVHKRDLDSSVPELQLFVECPGVTAVCGIPGLLCACWDLNPCTHD